MTPKQSYLHVRYAQMKYSRDVNGLRQAKWEAGVFNVLRRVDKDGNWVPKADIPNSDVGTIRSRTSLWIKPNKYGEKDMLGKLGGCTRSRSKLLHAIHIHALLSETFYLSTPPYRQVFQSGAATAIWITVLL